MSSVRVAPPLGIDRDDVTRPDVGQLLQDHLDDMFASSPPESVHALTSSELAQPGVGFWTVRDANGLLLGCGALKYLDDDSVELKSMRTVPSARGLGIGAMMLDHLLREARASGYRDLFLETGTQPFFAPARRLYRRAGFEEVPPFAGYTLDPSSVYLHLRL